MLRGLVGSLGVDLPSELQSIAPGEGFGFGGGGGSSVDWLADTWGVDQKPDQEVGRTW